MISPLGVALALVQDVVERTIVDPSPHDLVRIRREAIDAAIRSGAAPDRIEVVLEVDRARNRVRAAASGATALVEGATRAPVRARPNALPLRRARCAPSRRSARRRAHAGVHRRRANRALAVVDERAVVRLIAPRAAVALTTAAGLATALAATIEEHTTYGDVGRALPDLWLLAGARIIELTGLTNAEDAAAPRRRRYRRPPARCPHRDNRRPPPRLTPALIPSGARGRRVEGQPQSSSLVSRCNRRAWSKIRL